METQHCFASDPGLHAGHPHPSQLGSIWKRGHRHRCGRLGQSMPSEIIFSIPHTRARSRLILRPCASVIQELSHNQVLLSATIAATLGQVSKPFIAALRGRGFNWKLAVTSGGMPSCHAACVTAACTCIALERGFDDSLFGLSAILAGLVMYDAQGVRRAVGKQAEVINTWALSSTAPDSLSAATNRRSSALNTQQTLLSSDMSVQESRLLDKAQIPTVQLAPVNSANKDSPMTILSETGRRCKKSEVHPELNGAKGMSDGSAAYDRSAKFFEVAEKLPSVKVGEVNVQEIGNLDGLRHIPLKESVGHTKLEVVVGGLWGIIWALAFSQVLFQLVGQGLKPQVEDVANLCAWMNG